MTTTAAIAATARRTALAVIVKGAVWTAATGVPEVRAQQMVTDDAAVVEHRACQLEVWYGENDGWFLPACGPARNLEVTPGLGYLPDDGDGRQAIFLAEAKGLLRDVERDGIGYGLVVGVAVDPGPGVEERRAPEIYAYAPVSLTAVDGRVVVHKNLGWLRERATVEETRNRIIWGLRTDLDVGQGFTVLAELFGQGGDEPQFQVGLRRELLADRLEVDLTWGGNTASGEDGLGFTAGVAWTPPPIF